MSKACTLCNMTIAPADPGRVEHRGRTVHRSCIIRRQDAFQAICAEVDNLMVLCRLPREDDEWRRQYEAGRVCGYDCLVKVLRCCFRRIENWRKQFGAEGPYIWPTAEVVAGIRDQLSQRLYCDL